MKRIGIIDYGSGNIFSLVRAFKHLGFQTEVLDRPEHLAHCTNLVLPGVGAFQTVMQKLQTSGLIDAVHTIIKQDRPLLAICVGMQILFESGQEFGNHAGLGVIDGVVKKIPETDIFGHKLLVPHIGWSETWRTKSGCEQINYDIDIFSQLDVPKNFYYLHSYSAVSDQKCTIAAETNYGGHVITAAIQRGNLFGTQFHPEKSGSAGLNLLKNFAMV
jgi:glutamine amidotransferase